MQPDDPERIAVALRRAAASLIASSRSLRDVDHAVGDLVRVPVATVGGADGGVVSRLDRGVLQASHATDEVIAEVDDLQNTLQEGPCTSAAQDAPPHGLVHADDLASPEATERWPNFAPQAAALGYRSLLGVAIHTGKHRYASLNLHARRPGAFDDDARMTATLFGSQAALLLFGAESAAGLDQALETRDVIGQSEGILVERHRIDRARAFAQLVEASQHANLELNAVARWLVDEVEQSSRASSGSPG